MTANVERARLLIGQRRYDMARQELAVALGEDPNDPLAHSLLATCLAEAEEFGEATEHAQKGVGLAPDTPFTHYVLARVFALRNRPDEAAEAVTEAIRLNPFEPNFHELLGRVRLAQSRWEDALAAATKALEVDPEHVGAKNLRAQSLRKLGRSDHAEDELAKALEIDPDDAWTHANLGWTFLERGDRTKAMHHFREALRLDSELEWARHGVVETLKANNVFYRIFFQYFVWMARLGTRGQWMVILGAWVLYQVLRRIAATTPALEPWVTPLLVAYLAFALGTWFAVPLANLALRLHPFGRLALSRDERRASNWIGVFLLAAIASGVTYLCFPGPFLKDLAFFFLLMLLPLGATFQAASPWPRKGLAIYAAATAGLGLLGLGVSLFPEAPPDPDNVAPLVVLGMLVVALAHLVFPIAALVSLFAGNVLMSIRWKR